MKLTKREFEAVTDRPIECILECLQHPQHEDLIQVTTPSGDWLSITKEHAEKIYQEIVETSNGHIDMNRCKTQADLIVVIHMLTDAIEGSTWIAGHWDCSPQKQAAIERVMKSAAKKISRLVGVVLEPVLY